MHPTHRHPGTGAPPRGDGIIDLLTPAQRAWLRAHGDAAARGAAAHDPAPVVKFFNPLGAATWLATELDSDDDTLFGLADLGFGCPELGSFSLSEIAALRLPFGLAIERDLTFESETPLSVWADAARRAGSIIAAERLVGSVERARTADPDADPLPPPGPGGG